MSWSVLRAGETVLLRRLRPGRSGRRTATALSEVARHGRGWAAVTALGLLHPSTRRPAASGASAWGVATAGAFAAKGVARRRRPSLVGFGSRPSSSSMPSSHTASAFAYATAATLQRPALGLALVPVAGAVGWSRAATARHFPTDVAAGAILGVVAGAAVHVLAGRVAPSRAEPAAPELTGR